MKNSNNATAKELKQKRLETGLLILNDLQDLTWGSQEECVFGEPLDLPLFQKCMKDVYEYFTPIQKSPRFNSTEAKILAQITAFAWLPAAEKTEHSVLFEAGTHAAIDLAKVILNGATYPHVRIGSGRMVAHYFSPETGEHIAEYDFEKGDLSDFVKLVEMGYWEW